MRVHRDILPLCSYFGWEGDWLEIESHITALYLELLSNFSILYTQNPEGYHLHFNYFDQKN